MDVIFPCAGLSSRFPGTRPKFLLTDYSGRLMVERSMFGIGGKKHVVILKDHVDQYDAENILRDCLGDFVNIIVLDEPTNGPAETVYRALEQADIAGPFLIKDCDSFFSFTPKDDSVNVVYTSRLSNNPDLNKVAQLSYVVSNDQSVISSIIEKQVISDKFCVGGYQFAHKFAYMSAYNAVKNNSHKELYISTIIEYLIANDYIFTEAEVTDYVNVGTLDAWLRYNDRPTIFCDIDGVLVKNQSAYGAKSYENADYVPLENNVKALLEKKKQGCKIIFVTARLSEYRNVTRKMLDELGFGDCDLLMGIHHSKRVLINDFTHSNPYPSAVAVNVERDKDNLKDYLAW
jgi:dTDP-glucose pyrophosphorylase